VTAVRSSRRPPEPTFDHVLAMTDAIGMFEHADGTEPRRHHGYCTDDMARLLVVIAREPAPDDAVRATGRTAFRFLEDAQGPAGHIRNRRSVHGQWEDGLALEDCWGRSLWAFGTAARRASDAGMRRRAAASFRLGSGQRSPWRRAMAFAAMGAAEVLAEDPDDGPARAVLSDAADTIGPLGRDASWPWPEPRLAYANPVLAETLLAAGDLLQRPDLLADGLTLLRWLLDRETLDGHLSPTPAGGSGPGDHAPSFDQQPIEVAAMADACARAAAITGEDSWGHGVDLAVRWFTGDNDTGDVMVDPVSGGGYDGLHARGPNLNQGAESTLALISTLQQGRRMAAA
jgi:hypothetical protein